MMRRRRKATRPFILRHKLWVVAKSRKNRSTEVRSHGCNESVCSGIHGKGASKTMSNFGTARGEVLACGGKGSGGFWLVAVPQLLEDSENGCCLTFAARRLFPWTVSLLSFPFCFMVCYVLPCSKGC